MDTCDYVNDSFIKVADPHNIGLSILFGQLSAILVEIIFFNNSGANLHKNDTGDVLLTC